MQKTIKSLIVLTITAFLCFALALACFNIKDASAAVINNLVYFDEFDSENGKLSDDLITFGGATFKTDYRAMRINTDDYDWNAHIVNGGYKLEYDKINTSCTVEITLDIVDDNGAWFAFSYGVEDVSYGFPYSSGALIFYSSGSNLFKSVNGALANADGSNYVRKFKIFQGKKVKLSVQFDKVSGEKGYYYLSATCIDALTEEVIGSDNYGKVYVSDGYFGFNSSTMKVDIFDFRVYENGNSQPAFYDDFSAPAVSYTGSEAENPVWYATSFWNRSNLIVGSIGRLDITKAGSGVIYKEPVSNAEDKGLNLLYILFADFYLDAMTNSAESGFIIGADKNGDGGAFIGLRKNLTDSELSFHSDGKESERAGVFTDPVINLSVSVFYDGRAEVKVNGVNYSFDLDSVVGYIGLKTFANSNDVGAYVDNFSYENSEYVESKSADSKSNFEDVKETEIAGFTVYDYYCSSKDWYKSNEISLPFVVGDNGYLIFSNAGDYCCFAPKKKYNDFIVRFDVKFSVVKSGNIFGIEMGKTDISQSATNSVYVGFQNIGGGTYYISNKCVSDEGFTNRPITAPIGAMSRIFVEGETYNFMAIAKNGVVTIHVKNANEPESVLSYVRARFENVDTDGYVAMFAANGVSLQLDNFSIVNLDYEYFTDDYSGGEKIQTFRYDFSAGTDGREFSAVSGGIVNKNDVETIRGQEGIYTSGKVGANITRIRFAEIQSGASYKHGNIVVGVNEANGKITVSDGITERTINLGQDFVYNNALLEIEETLGKVVVSFVSGDQPLAAITNNVYEFAVNNSLNFEKIYIISSGKASVKELSVFNLDTNVSISSGVYVPQEVRIVRTSVQENNSGCSGAINGDIYVLLALGTVFAIFMTVKRRKDNG